MGSNKEIEVKNMTIEEAKKLYFKYDCSLFAMARENKNAYENYKTLKLSNAIEQEWNQELFFILWEQLKETGESVFFNRMHHLTEKFHNRESLIIMKEALNFIKYDNLENKVCISETVIGRKEITVRSGMIFWAYDLGEKELAVELLRFVMNLLNSETSDEEIRSRIERDMKKCVMMDSMLKLGICDDTNR